MPIPRRGVRSRFLLLRWFATAFFTALQIATVKIYQAKGNFTSAQKSAFNAIMLALALLLSLNIAESFKDLVKTLRPTLKISAQEHTKEGHLIDNLESFLSVWKLLREIWGKPGFMWLAAFSVFWLSLNLAAQSAVTASSQTFTVNDGFNYKDTYTQPGTVNIPDLSCYYKNSIHKVCEDQVTISTIAHSYGEIILASSGTAYNDFDDILHHKDMPPYFHRETPSQQQVSYRFNEYNLNDIQRVYPYLTNRTIFAEAKNCITYDNITTDQSDTQILTYTGDSGENATISIPADFLGREGTTYIYRGFKFPPTADLQSCGERCLWMWVYKNPSGFPKGSPEPTALYKCPVSISDVNNASRLEHHIPDGVVKIAAVAIALHGEYHGIPGNLSDDNFSSFQFYASGSPWDIHDHTADYVGDRLALFALGSLISMANLNPLIQIPGNVPYLGHRLATYEPWFTIIWACIVGMHLAVTTGTMLLVWRANQKRPSQETYRMDVRRTQVENDSRVGLAGGPSGGGDGDGEDSESVGGGEEYRHDDERRNIGDREAAGQQGPDHV